MILKGLRFGMLLQLAIGPMAMMVFHASSEYGFLFSLQLVLAIALIDALYITLSCFGAAALINKSKIKKVIKLMGFLVLVLFGINTLSSVLSFSFLPEFSLFSNATSENLFVQGLLLTASNPLTILFWSSVFSAQMIENNWNKHQLFFFSIGSVSATLTFLIFIAFMGSLLSSFLPDIIVQILNLIVGLSLIVFGIRLLFKKI